MHSLLQYLEGGVALPQNDRGRSRLLLSGFVLVSVLLAYACFENCSLSRALRARDAEMQQHILTVRFLHPLTSLLACSLGCNLSVCCQKQQGASTFKTF